MGFIDFTNGEVLTAGQMDETFRQTVMRFANASARDTALSEVLAEGMMAYLDDTNEVLKYDGSQWIDISGDITGVTAGTALTGGGTSGDVTLDVDTAAVGSAIGIDTKQDDVITTQGDIVIGDASGDPVRLPVGSADQVLTSDGTTVSFQDAGGGGGSTLIASGSLSNASLSITSIPQTYKALKLFISDYEYSANSIAFRFNNDTGTNYGYTRIRNSIGFDVDSTFLSISAGNDDSPAIGFLFMDINNYTSSTSPTVTSSYKVSQEPGEILADIGVGGYLGASAVTSIQSPLNFVSADYELYGVV